MSSISKVTIANMALGHVGARDSIESFSEESTAARQANLWYDFARKQCLEAFDWSFARKRLTLALIEEVASGDELQYEWKYRYQYPSDCVTARYIVNPLGKDADAVPFEIETSEDNETRTILTNMEDAVLVYTFDLESTDLFSYHFIETLSYLLASQMAFNLTGKAQLKGEMFNLFINMLSRADAADANERVGEPPRDADWIRLRNN